jgi:hypothetical protein
LEAQRVRVRADLEELTSESKSCAPPTRLEIEARIAEIHEHLKPMDRTSREKLGLLVGKICAVPMQQFGTNKIVLRAKFELRLVALLPAQTRVALALQCGGRLEEQFERIPMEVDLFHSSTGPRYGMAALALETQGLGLTAIGKALGINKRQANIAVQYGRDLCAAGRSAPFTELTEPPVAASRWRTRGRAKPTSAGLSAASVMPESS